VAARATPIQLLHDGWWRAVNENDASELVTALYDRWFTKLVAFAARATESHELAEDLAQDSFMQLYLAVRAGKDIEHPKAWTLCVLRRAMNRRMRERFRCDSLDEAEQAGRLPITIPKRLALSDIRSLLSTLSAREEEVLLLRLEAMKYREIAEQLGISVNSVNTLLSRALRKLQDAMSQTEPEKGKHNAEGKTIRAS
jgi:RNA polymerase sigma-70 factor (ECF subfamily)